MSNFHLLALGELPAGPSNSSDQVCGPTAASAPDALTTAMVPTVAAMATAATAESMVRSLRMRPPVTAHWLTVSKLSRLTVLEGTRQCEVCQWSALRHGHAQSVRWPARRRTAPADPQGVPQNVRMLPHA